MSERFDRITCCRPHDAGVLRRAKRGNHRQDRQDETKVADAMRDKCLARGVRCFIANRIGDFGFILAIFAVIATFGSAQYTSVVSAAASYPVEPLGHWGLMSWIALGLM